jgi:hypothetical protein
MPWPPARSRPAPASRRPIRPTAGGHRSSRASPARLIPRRTWPQARPRLPPWRPSMWLCPHRSQRPRGRRIRLREARLREFRAVPASLDVEASQGRPAMRFPVSQLLNRSLRNKRRRSSRDGKFSLRPRSKRAPFCRGRPQRPDRRDRPPRRPSPAFRPCRTRQRLRLRSRSHPLERPPSRRVSRLASRRSSSSKGRSSFSSSERCRPSNSGRSSFSSSEQCRPSSSG